MASSFPRSGGYPEIILILLSESEADTFRGYWLRIAVGQRQEVVSGQICDTDVFRNMVIVSRIQEWQNLLRRTQAKI